MAVRSSQEDAGVQGEGVVVSEDLLRLVETELLPALDSDFHVVSSEVSESFDNANVELQSPGLRIRVVRERGRVFADFGPVSEPNTWFDSAVLIDYLGLSPDAGFHDRDARRVLHGIAAFVTSLFSELREKFDPQHLAATKRDLEALMKERAAKLFGS